MKNEMTMNEFLRLLDDCNACPDGYYYCEQFSTPEEALKDMKGEWLSWLMRRKQFSSLAKYVTWDRIICREWVEILHNTPTFIDKCDTTKLTGFHWVLILKEQPSLIEHCDVSKISEGYKIVLLKRQPQLTKYIK